MSEEKKEDAQAPKWKHDQELSFSGARALLLKVKEGLDTALEAQKAELKKMVGARDSLK